MKASHNQRGGGAIGQPTPGPKGSHNQKGGGAPGQPSGRMNKPSGPRFGSKGQAKASG